MNIILNNQLAEQPSFSARVSVKKSYYIVGLDLKTKFSFFLILSLQATNSHVNVITRRFFFYSRRTRGPLIICVECESGKMSLDGKLSQTNQLAALESKIDCNQIGVDVIYIYKETFHTPITLSLYIYISIMANIPCLFAPYRFLWNKFEESYTPTIEDFHRKLYRIRGEVHQLDILDTSGNHPFPAMRRLSFLTGIPILSYIIIKSNLKQLQRY